MKSDGLNAANVAYMAVLIYKGRSLQNTVCLVSWDVYTIQFPRINQDVDHNERGGMIQAVTNWNELVLVRKLEPNMTTYMYTVRRQRWTQARTQNWVKQLDKFYIPAPYLRSYRAQILNS